MTHKMRVYVLSYDERYHGYRCLQCQVPLEINDIMFVCVREKRRKGMTKTSMEQHVVNEVIKTNSFSFSAWRLLGSSKQTCGTDTKNKLVPFTPNTVHFSFLSMHIPPLFQGFFFFFLLLLIV